MTDHRAGLRGLCHAGTEGDGPAGGPSRLVVRGDGGEIRIEVTPKTTLSESFQFGDRIKAKVLPNDQALTIERATPDDPLGIHTP